MSTKKLSSSSPHQKLSKGTSQVPSAIASKLDTNDNHQRKRSLVTNGRSPTHPQTLGAGSIHTSVLEIATASRTQEVNPNSVLNNDERVRKIGKKARERLNEERSKRKEIVRLDTNVELEVGRKSSTFAQAVKQKPTKRRNISSKSTLSSMGRSSTKHFRRNSKGIDCSSYSKTKIDKWLPQTHRLLSSDDIPKEQKSNIIRLHALPLGVTADHIRKFFSGLSPQRIFLIPSLNVTIKDFDATYSDNDSNNNINNERHLSISKLSSKNFKRHVVKRHPNYFRVFVKFQSHLIADTAIARSGEAIHIDENNAASIAITPVTKTISHHLQRFMGIDAKRGELLENTLDEVEAKIPRVVNELIWSMAKKEVGLNFSDSTIGGNDFSTSLYPYPTIHANQLYQMFPPSTKERKQNMVTFYNNLCDMYETLERECTPLLMQDFDPILTSISPEHHLIKTVSMWILDQLEITKKCLVSYYRLQKK